MPKHKGKKRGKNRVYRQPVYFKQVRRLAKKNKLPIPHDDTAPIFDQAIEHLLNGGIRHIKLVMANYSKVTPRTVRLGMLDFFRELDAKQDMDKLVIDAGNKAYETIVNH